MYTANAIASSRAGAGRFIDRGSARRRSVEARQVVVDLVPARLRADPDVLARPHARIVVERAHRHDREAAARIDARQLRAADPAERLRVELRLGDLVARELAFA